MTALLRPPPLGYNIPYIEMKRGPLLYFMLLSCTQNKWEILENLLSNQGSFDLSLKIKIIKQYFLAVSEQRLLARTTSWSSFQPNPGGWAFGGGPEVLRTRWVQCFTSAGHPLRGHQDEDVTLNWIQLGKLSEQEARGEFPLLSPAGKACKL